MEIKRGTTTRNKLTIAKDRVALKLVAGFIPKYEQMLCNMAQDIANQIQSQIIHTVRGEVGIGLDGERINVTLWSEDGKEAYSFAYEDGRTIRIARPFEDIGLR